MAYFHKLRLANCDTRLLHHLRRGGGRTDEKSGVLIYELIREALSDRQVSLAANEHGFSEEDLYSLYLGMLLSLPNPCIKTGSGPRAPIMLAASLPFMEPPRLNAMLGALREELVNALLKSTGVFSDTERLNVIFAFAAEHAKTMFATHTATRGEAAF